MTRIYYSTLPPEAQEAIQKLTGLGAEELEAGEKGKVPASIAKVKKTEEELEGANKAVVHTTTAKASKTTAKPKASLKKTLLILAWIVGISLAVMLLGYFLAAQGH